MACIQCIINEKYFLNPNVSERKIKTILLTLQRKFVVAGGGKCFRRVGKGQFTGIVAILKVFIAVKETILSDLKVRHQVSHC